MTKILFCFIFLIGCNLWSKTPELEAFFVAAKNKDFETARTVSTKMENAVLERHLNILTELMATKSVTTDFVTGIEQADNEAVSFIKYLIAGYQNNYAEKQNNLEAYKNFLNALKLAEKTEKRYFIKAALFGMLDLFAGEIFIGSKQYQPYLERLTELKEDKVDDVLLLFYRLIFLSKTEEDLSALDAQYYTYYQKLDSIFSGFANHFFYTDFYYEKGIYYKLEAEYDKAEDFFLKSDSMAFQHNLLNDYKFKNAWQLSSVNFQNQKLKKAKRYLALAKRYSKKLREDFYNDRLASLIFQKEGNYDSAYHYLRKSVDIEYELGYKNNTLESSILTVQNQTDKLKLDKLELESSNAKIRNWTILLGMLLVLGAVIGVLVNKNAIRKQLLAEQERTMERQKMSNILKEQELATIDAMIEGQEKERQRVANELHDDLGSLMAAVKLQFNSLEASDKKGNQETFAKTENLIDEAYGKIRAIAHAKNSGLIAKQGLLQAVNLMAEKVSVASGISIMVHDHGLDTRLENSMELTLFRIIQELMTNVIKHAEATEMNIHITNHGDTLNILAEDNGKGMPLDKTANYGNGMGLKSIDKRINHLHGAMNIESETGKGTVIILDIPI
ncbi:sensor histidine kinase [Maribacter sp. LLG6340-A2]|uniref:sensor histidine kinase n=1 Tax=Maribacter sp. LLG6340-A2 TaxID=3160834 RepID=UPI0038670C64